MESGLDQDQKCLIDCLSATLDTNHDIRSFAEDSLKQASINPGCGAALAKIIFNKEIPFGLRQLSAVLLKQFIQQHWQEDEENFVPPIVSAEEKGVIWKLLMLSLDDSHGQIRTAVGMAMAAIGQYDWPEEWPELIPFLLKLINDESNQNGGKTNRLEKAVSPGDDLGNRGESISVTKKKLKKEKKKGKNQISKEQDIQSKPEKQDLKEKKLKESIEMDEENAEEISSVDEDYSRGMKKWLMEYKESRPGIDVLQQRIDDFISDHEGKLEQEKQEREAAAAEGGWTVVAHHKGRKKTTDAESGITVGSVAPAAVLDKMSKKKSKEVTLDFYRFQRRDAGRNELMMLQEKFEQDKKRIQELRAARKFRPY